ncbi:MAG: DNA repair protein RecN [Nitrospirae bacterium]|nr:DNA repair protein RecN [Nitrospirota bacterium]
MLLELHIKDFAIIQELRLEFEKGLNVITGETGAGKSIIIDALQALLGGKGFQDHIREGTKEAVIEGKFLIPPHFPLKEKYQELNYLQKDDPEIIVRRIISSSGKSRSFLNGEMVNLSSLSELSDCLMEIHGQNHQTSLFKKSTQLFMLDAFGGLKPLAAGYETAYRKWTKAVQTLQELESKENEKEAKRSFLRFQVNELESAGLLPDEEVQLSQESEVLSKSETLRLKSEEAYHLLVEDETAVLTHLQKINRLLSDLFLIDPQVEPMMQLLSTASLQLKETSNLLRNYRERVEFNPEKLEQIEKRLFILSQMKKKYGKPVPEIIGFLEKIKKELDELDDLESDIHRLKQERNALESSLDKLGDELSAKRKEASREFEKKILKELKELKIDHAQFKIIFLPNEGGHPFSRHGKEEISFLISTNKGYEPAEMEKVVSGGELSRLMLALKTMISDAESVPIVIFDEIDPGVGGAVAEYIGKKLWDVASPRQVFCITHLPQIASFGQSHFTVEKKSKNGKTEVAVKLLNRGERVHEIARMLGGIEVTQKTLKHAEEMMK